MVHARTKRDGYKPPAHWEWVARVAETVRVPVLANGEVWSLADYLRCREVSGVADIMLGRGLVSRPDLARQIAAWRDGADTTPMTWAELWPLLQDFWRQARGKLAPRYAPGRLKQWLAMLTRNSEAAQLFAELRRENDCERLDARACSSRLLFDIYKTKDRKILIYWTQSAVRPCVQSGYFWSAHGAFHPCSAARCAAFDGWQALSPGYGWLALFAAGLLGAVALPPCPSTGWQPRIALPHF